MSADNWAICPKCEITHLRQQQRAFDRAQDAYGKVTSEEYEKMMNAARLQKESTIKESLREEFEIGILGMEFEVSYSGHCSKCQFDFNFSHKEKLT